MLKFLSSFIKSTTFINSQFEYVLNNKIIVYDTFEIIFQIVTIIKKFSEI